MSVTEVNSNDEEPVVLNKRKREVNEEDLEIDLNAPEPPSKKALRKAKKAKIEKRSKIAEESKPQEGEAAEDTVPNRGKRSEYGIWIGNLSFATSKQDLLDFMTGDTLHVISKEKITRIHLPAGPVKCGKPQNKGFAYVDLSDPAALNSALELSEKLLAGRRVLIKDANNFEGRPKGSSKDIPTNPPSKRIFVGNLEFDTTVDDLKKHFGVCGPIQHTHMATFEDSGKCKGYAWVEFEQLSAAQAAMRGWVEEFTDADADAVKRSKQRIWLNKIGGRKLRMEFAEDKTTRYNKRYGKNASQGKPNGNMPAAIEEVDQEDQGETGERQARGLSNGRQNAPPFRQSRQQDGKGQRGRGGYAQETVRKMTGAVVEAQGTKISFD